MPEWKLAPLASSEDATPVVDMLQNAEVALPAAVLGALAAIMLLRRALRPQRKLRRLDQVLPYAHAEPE